MTKQSKPVLGKDLHAFTQYSQVIIIMMSSPLTPDEITKVIQGPGDVEWRLDHISPSLQPADRPCPQIRNATGMSGNSSRSSVRTFRRVQVKGGSQGSQDHAYVPWCFTSDCNSMNSYLILSRINSVCIRDAKEAFSVKPRFTDDFTYLVLDVEDNEEQNLIRLFPGYGIFYSGVAQSKLSI